MKPNTEYQQLQAQLQQHDKRALAMALIQQSAPQKSNDYLLIYVDTIERMLNDRDEANRPRYAPKNEASRRKRIYEAISAERTRQNTDWGRAMEVLDMKCWTARLTYAVHEASVSAQDGDDENALERVLTVARDAVACLEKHLPVNATDELDADFERALNGNSTALKKRVNALREDGQLPKVPSKRFRLDERAMERETADVKRETSPSGIKNDSTGQANVNQDELINCSEETQEQRKESIANHLSKRKKMRSRQKGKIERKLFADYGEEAINKADEAATSPALNDQSL